MFPGISALLFSQRSKKMNTLAIILGILLLVSIPLGAKSAAAYRKVRIEKRAKNLGYDLTFDK